MAAVWAKLLHADGRFAPKFWCVPDELTLNHWMMRADESTLGFSPCEDYSMTLSALPPPPSLLGHPFAFEMCCGKCTRT